MANDISRVNADQVTISNEIVSSNDIYNIIISELWTVGIRNLVDDDLTNMMMFVLLHYQDDHSSDQIIFPDFSSGARNTSL